jgi:hypothetical protein
MPFVSIRSYSGLGVSHWVITNRVKQQVYVLFALFGVASCNLAIVGLGLRHRSKNGPSLISKLDIVRASPYVDPPTTGNFGCGS